MMGHIPLASSPADLCLLIMVIHLPRSRGTSGHNQNKNNHLKSIERKLKNHKCLVPCGIQMFTFIGA